MAAKGNSKINSGLQAASAYATRKGTVLGKWIATLSLGAVLSALTALFGFDDISAVMVVMTAFGAVAAVASTFPLLSTGIATYLVVTRRHAVYIFLLALALFMPFAWAIDWLQDFSLAASVALAYWIWVLAALYKPKSGLMYLFLVSLLGYIIYGATELMSQSSVALPEVARQYPRIALSVAIGTILIIALIANGKRVAEKDRVEYEEYKKKRMKWDEFRLEILEEDEQLEREGRTLTAVQKELRRRKMIELDPGRPPKLLVREDYKEMFG